MKWPPSLPQLSIKWLKNKMISKLSLMSMSNWRNPNSNWSKWTKILSSARSVKWKLWQSISPKQKRSCSTKVRNLKNVLKWSNLSHHKLRCLKNSSRVQQRSSISGAQRPFSIKTSTQRRSLRKTLWSLNLDHVTDPYLRILSLKTYSQVAK
jgi:hypothetical protein